MNNAGLLLGRLLLGVPFIIWGALKLTGAAAFSGNLAKMGLPSPLALAYLVGFCEVIGGLAVVGGFALRSASILLALWCLATGYLVHFGNRTAFFDHLVMAGGFFVLAAVGAGAWSFAKDRTLGLP
ncbi:MAG TPA: DoxX family protein [Beijerinckiaceae bacterium]|jgi:putative oxidoreductase|nr:DoxX family protein [Beijerinckiaceae bacterium]